ncbi:metallophosphoesterase [Beutenbergia cavernae DSM 12333]|uniref:Metallophosphoesterase n=1 Tax=Beutenbergia cavernae (strain ATCC BAA-8 / DSM 12333 / CCUG 43141 / JCM 11478 / NBRC 16432 / NCIMB 13614 / HKI 0122) TaxID=471853 RepID=C5C578_BEUC1|nr:metallophosphoesterase family protein [Beutenbergia cavernae]ACQ82218.1 metallophosphoesterase [Beutenbergia cavernae DSM 12333]
MHRSLRRTLSAVVAALLALALLAAPSWAGPPRHDEDFRVNPYLQNPSSTSMSVTWFSTTDRPGLLRLRAVDGHPRTRVWRTTPEEQPVLEYTQAELDEEIAGLEPGSWLLDGGSFKHVLDLTDLEPGTTYEYTVHQGRSRFTERFHTAPAADDWDSIRFIAMSDSETEPRGRVQYREWAPGLGGENRPAAQGSAWAETFGTAQLLGEDVLRYALTEDDGYRRNLDVVDARDPDFVLNTGDLVQGGGYQPGWDEWFRHNAGSAGSGLSSTPVLPAFGNWESFGALNGGYGTPEDRSIVVQSRAKYHAYFDAPGNGHPELTDSFYRIDYGPITVLTLDANNGVPDDAPANYPEDEQAEGREYFGPGTDTQNNFTRAEYEAAGGTDLADFHPGSAQWTWAEANLADARAAGQIVFVQFHHVPYSSGEHGLPMYHADTSGQGGTPMRIYHDMFERYGVTAVISGHSEMFERSLVDADGDGVGVGYYDVGVSGDGLRGERRDGGSFADPLLSYNEFSQWTADQHEAEQWAVVDGVPQLIDGGKHYGHLEVDVRRTSTGATVTFTPVYVFPVLDSEYEVVRTERRTYDDVVTLELDASGRIVG